MTHKESRAALKWRRGEVEAWRTSYGLWASANLLMSGASARILGDALRGPRVLLLEPDPEGAQRLSHVLSAAGIAVQRLDDVPRVDESPTASLLVANYDRIEASDRERLLDGALEDWGHRLLLYSTKAIRPQFSKVFGRWRFANLIAREPDLEDVELIATIRKLLNGNDIFGIDKYFPQCRVRETVLVTDSDARDDVLARICEFAQRAGARRRVASLLVAVGDELLTNAIYNAPVDDRGRPRHAHRPRTEAVALDRDAPIAVELRSDHARVGLSVSDPFGSLCADRILKYLSKCFRRGPDQVDEKAGGAGLGFYQAFEAVSHLAFNLAPSVRTEAIGIVSIGGSFRDFVVRGKSLNIFVGEGS